MLSKIDFSETECTVTFGTEYIYTQRQIELTSFTFAISARQKKSKTDEFFLKLTQAKDYLSSMV